MIYCNFSCGFFKYYKKKKLIFALKKFMHNSNIKSMILYNHVDRIYNELHEIGKKRTDPLFVNEIINFDQLHYNGIEAVNFAINKIGINLVSRSFDNWLTNNVPTKDPIKDNVIKYFIFSSFKRPFLK